MKSLFIILVACTSSLCLAQSLTSKDLLWKQIEAKNATISKAFCSGDVMGIIAEYMQDASIMPEHSTTRKGKNDIKQYYTDWLAGAKMLHYTKTILEIHDLDGWALEIGTFSQDFKIHNGKGFNYAGKYMVLWRVQQKLDTSPFIAAEIWGANDYIDDDHFPIINDIPKPAKETITDKTLEKEIIGRNQVIAQLVTERKGAEHAKLFMPDAIYMTYYTPMLIGMDKIKAYFIEHEKPGTLKIDTLELTTDALYATAAGPIVEFGSYKVDWTDGDAKGTVMGKSINVWKRDATGTLMLYRQMVNHD